MSSHHVIKRGFDDTQEERQRYQCKNCQIRFDDLTNTIFAGHHQPLGVWVLCLYLMGLNLSNHQICSEGEYARDEDGDEFHEVHVNSIEGFWSLLRSRL